MLMCLIILLAACLFVGVALLKKANRSHGLNDITIAPCKDYKLLLDEAIGRLSGRALSNAIYREAISRSLVPDKRKSLYDKYGYEVLSPKLESDQLFNTDAELMGDKEFLAVINEWIIAEGGEGVCSFWAASRVVGEMLVHKHLGKARQIIEKESAGE